jgi:hypothetical protein
MRLCAIVTLGLLNVVTLLVNSSQMVYVYNVLITKNKTSKHVN